VTTGKGCTLILKPCESYSGDIFTCEGYIGINGKCKGTNTKDTVGPCTIRVCEDAPTTLSTDKECNDF